MVSGEIVFAGCGISGNSIGCMDTPPTTYRTGKLFSPFWLRKNEIVFPCGLVLYCATSFLQPDTQRNAQLPLTKKEISYL